jgi:N-acetylmuramoyl-L-alanine amidase
MSNRLSPSTLLDLFLLALCVWREARGESLYGKQLVAQTIKNRVEDRRWPGSYRDVILQPWQFSSFNKNDPNVSYFPTNTSKSWKDCVEAAYDVFEAKEVFTTANHYHTRAVSPKWSDASKIVIEEGAHIFYKF